MPGQYPGNLYRIPRRTHKASAFLFYTYSILPAHQIHYFIINDISFHFCEELTAEVGLRIAKRSIRQTQARSFTIVPLRKTLRIRCTGRRI